MMVSISLYVLKTFICRSITVDRVCERERENFSRSGILNIFCVFRPWTNTVTWTGEIKSLISTFYLDLLALSGLILHAVCVYSVHTGEGFYNWLEGNWIFVIISTFPLTQLSSQYSRQIHHS